MDIGIGLQALHPDPDLSVVDWARRAEERGFSTLGTTDRLVYDTYEPLTALAVAAGATSRIRLTTAILLAPLRANHALFAKSAATLDRLSDGRLRAGPCTRRQGGRLQRKWGRFPAARQAVRRTAPTGHVAVAGPRRYRTTSGHGRMAPRCCSVGSPSPHCGG